MSVNGRVGFDLRAQDAKVDRINFKTIFSDGIIQGCALSNTTTSITVGVGTFNVHGTTIEIDSAETIALSAPIANGYARLIFHIDLDEVPLTATFTQGWFTYDYSATLGGFSALTQENINTTGKIYEVEFAVYTIVSSNCTALVRNIKTVGSEVEYTPTFTGFSTDPTGVYHTIQIINGIAIIRVLETTNGTSNANSFTFTSPIAAKTVSGGIWVGYGRGVDNSSTLITPVMLTVTSGSTSIGVSSTWASGTSWTTSGGKRLAFGTISFPID